MYQSRNKQRYFWHKQYIKHYVVFHSLIQQTVLVNLLGTNSVLDCRDGKQKDRMVTQKEIPHTTRSCKHITEMSEVKEACCLRRHLSVKKSSGLHTLHQECAFSLSHVKTANKYMSESGICTFLFEKEQSGSSVICELQGTKLSFCNNPREK